MAERRDRFRRHVLVVGELAGEDREAERVGAAVSELLADLGHFEATVGVVTLAASSVEGSPVETEGDEAFLGRLRQLGENWRYSDEFIGLIVRRRFPRNYDDLRPE